MAEMAGELEHGKKIKEKEKMGHCIELWFGLLPWALVWAEMGLVSKEWAWVEGNGVRRCKGAE